MSDHRKSNAEAVLSSLGKRSSLLVHPHGIEVLEEHKKIKVDDKGLSADEEKLAKELQDELHKGDKIWKKETVISDATQQVLNNHWNTGTTTGEKAEAVDGESQGVKLVGHPDVVLHIAVTPNNEQEGGDKKNE